MVVLSEHVDYWNHDGWKDPYSSHSYTDRQNTYAERFQLDSPYTPQMVVDGKNQFVGSNSELADKAFAEAVVVEKISVHISPISLSSSNTLGFHVETGRLDPSFRVREAEVFVAIALNHAESQVSAGENAGHRLPHVAVVRRLTKIGTVKQGQAFAQDIQLKTEPEWDSHNLRVIAFLQEPHQGRVLGAALQPVTATPK